MTTSGGSGSATIRERDYRGLDPDRLLGRSLVWRLRQPLVPIVKAGLRRWGTATAGQRCLPDYLIIGAKRSGSTTLARALLAHDDVLGLFPGAEQRKGVYYFDVHHDRGVDWYRGHFPTEKRRARAVEALGRPVVVGEASPWYLHHPHAPQRAAQLVPDALVVCLLRDPEERARSHHAERVRQGLEPIGDFAEALEAEGARLDGEFDSMVADPDYVSLAHLNHGYAAQSSYRRALARWRDAFGTRLVTVDSERLFAAPESVVAAVRDRLGLTGPTRDHTTHFNRLDRPRPSDGHRSQPSLHEACQEWVQIRPELTIG